MANSTLSDLADLLMTKVDDYRLVALYQASVVDFETYIEAWLISAITEFEICDQSLSYNSSTKSFSVELSDKNKEILAQIMVKKWLEKEVNDITQMNLHILDKDYRVYSEAQNLTAKQNLLIQKKEEISQILTAYGYKTVNWSDWLSGTFYSV